MVQAADVLEAPKGRLRLDVFEGDVRRRELTRDEIEQNRLWQDEGKLWVPKGWDGGALPAYGRHRQGPGARLAQVSEHADDPSRALPALIGELLSEPFDTHEFTNLVTTNGKGLLLDRLFAMGGPPGQITHMGVGNSATAAAVGDTQLAGATPSPDLRAFDALPTRAGLVVTALRTYATGEGNMNWQEIGLFNGATNGTSILFNRIAPIGAFNKTSAVSIVATVTITQT